MNLPYFNRDTYPFIKNLWLFFVFAFFSIGANAQFSGCGEFYHITITNQYDMNQFALNYPECTEIPGNLRIETSNITDLSQLEQITSVGGSIYIGATNLTDLDGLQNITHVGHDVRIRNNSLLVDISALSNLNSDFVAWTGYGLEITNNPLLSTCNLPNFCSYLLNSSNFRTIQNNAGDCSTNAAMVQLCTPVTVCPSGSITLNSQAALNAFAINHPNCIQIIGSVKIEGDDITDLAPLSNITTITESLTIRTKNLTSLNGLHNLQKIGKYLHIYETELLTTLDGLDALTEVRGEIIIRTNLALNDISALSNIDSSLIRTVPIAADSYGINIFGNPQLTTCNIPNFCSYLSNPTNSRNILNNSGNCNSASLTYACIPEITTCPMTDLVFNSQADLDAYGQFYPDCIEIYHSVTISGAVTDLSPLHKIQVIRGNLTISGTTGLTDLHDLSILTAVHGNVTIHNNLNLVDISGLSGIKTINNLNNGLTITNNPALTICEVPNICMYLVNAANPRNIENNLGNCNNATMATSCIPVLPTCPVSGLVFNTQAQVDAFGLYYPNCTAIPDSVVISGAAITDLSPLGNIQTIEGELSISGTSGLTNLNDLSSLTSVLGSVSISNNINLQDISGLSGIISFNGLTIINNPALTICEVPNICMYLVNPANPRNIGNNSGNCNNATIGASCIPVLPTCPASNVSFDSQAQVDAYGLYYPNCTEISGSLSISGGTITDLSPLNAIQTINGRLNILGTSFTNLNSLGNLISVKNLSIRHNSQLQDISGLSDLLELSVSNSTGLIIEYNPLLATCSIPGICAYTSNINNPRTISNNAGGCANNGALGLACEALSPSCPESTSIGFANQQQLDNFALNYPNCTNFPGHINIQADLDLTPLQNLQTIGGNLSINYNIHDLDGLNALTSIGGNLTIQDSNQLQNLNALQNLTSIGGSLIIRNIPLLVNLDQLESLTHIGTGIRLESNVALEDISALSQLNTMVPPNWGTLWILNNPLLATCNVPYICSYLLNPDASYLILGNAGDCVSHYSVVTACNSTSCATPSNLTASNITIDQAKISWSNGDNFNDFAIEFGPSGFTIGTGTTVTGITANSYLLSGLQMGVVYDVYLKKDCGYNDSTALMITFSTVGYCIPSVTNTSSESEDIYIKNFTTTGAITNISNIDSGYSANGYGNFSESHSASHYPGQTINFEAVGGNGTGTRGLKIWIDWDNSIAFEEASELVFSSAALQSGTHSGNFQIPANTAPGNYRMRLFLQENTLPADPCNTTAQATAFGELEDYTLTVLELSPCDLDTVTSTNIISNSATLNWTSQGSLFEMEWGPAGFTQGMGTQQNGITTTSYTLQGLTEQTTYDVYVRNICTYNQSSWVKHTFATRSVCPSGDLVLQTQAHIDDLGTNYPNCTAIAGNVYINGTYSNINNLAPLNNIVSISGSFNLHGLPQLTSVNGFTSLTTIGGAIDIYDTKLTNLNGLTSLTNVGNSITIAQNTLLTNISGIKYINPDTLSSLMIYNNTGLAICNYDFICNYISGSASKYFANNAVGCQDQQAVTTACTTCDAPANVTHIPGASAYTINWTSQGESFDIEWGTEGFVQGTGIQQNGINTTTFSLPDLSELASYDIYIRRNCFIQSEWTKYTFTTVDLCPEGHIRLQSQAEVNAFAANYPYCTEIQDSLLIYDGADITDLSPLSNITSIGGLSISNNPQLTDISALQNIVVNTDNTSYIQNNPLLAICNIQAICTLMQNLGFVDITNNAPGCNSTAEVAYQCGLECPPGNVNLYSQADVDAFATRFPNCTAIQSYLIIDGNDITDLSPLSNIATIGTSLLVYNNPLLTTLNGLESLTSIGYELVIQNNPMLSVCNIQAVCSYLGDTIETATITNNATGCENLAAVATACGVEMPACPIDDIVLSSQQDVDNFAINYPNCPHLPVSLIIYNSEDITDLSSLSNIVSIDGGLSIVGNSNISNLDAFSSLTSAGGILIIENTDLTDISGLQNINLENMNQLSIQYNPNLSVCNIPNFCTYLSNPDNEREIEGNAPGCESFQEVALACGFEFCPEGEIMLTSQAEINDFAINYPNCTQILGSLDIFGEDITDLSPLNNIASIAEWFAIYDCPQLTEINGLSALTHIGSYIYIGINNELNSLDGLSSITSVGGGIYIEQNPQITNLDGLSAVTSLENDIYIWSNAQLTDISGLQNIAPENIGNLTVLENENLSVCNIPNFCTYLSDLNNPRTISGNAQDCISSEAVENKCFSGNCASYTIWNGDSWSNGDPDNTKRVIILDDFIVSSEMDACELLLSSGTFTVNAGAVLTVEGEIQNIQTANNFIVHSDANLIQLEEVDNVGAITVNRNSFPLYRQDYTLWSSPVDGQNLRNFSPETVFNRFYSYDTAAGTFGEYVQELFTPADTQTKTFADAKGYMIRMPNNWPVFENESIPGTPFAGTFKGVPNNGTITIPLSTANTAGNLVGNPYPSSINIETFFDANPDIEHTLYFWRKRNGVNGSGYATYTALGLQSSLPEINGLDLNNMIKPGQGFLVKAIAPTVLNFNNQMRSGGQNGHFLRDSNSNKHRFWLNLSANTNLVGQALIGYVDGATQGVDNGLDGAYFNDSAIALTSLIDTQEYAIQARSLPFEVSDIVPLGFKTTVAGNYKISLSAFDGLFENNQNIFIKDNQTGMQQNLKLFDYEFTTSEGIFNDRFQVVYQATTLGIKNPEIDTNSIVLYQQNKQIHINSGVLAMKKVELFDIRGRLIYTQDVDNTVTRINQLNITNQVLIVKILVDDNREEIRKIVY